MATVALLPLSVLKMALRFGPWCTARALTILTSSRTSFRRTPMRLTRPRQLLRRVPVQVDLTGSTYFVWRRRSRRMNTSSRWRPESADCYLSLSARVCTKISTDIGAKKKRSAPTLVAIKHTYTYFRISHALVSIPQSVEFAHVPCKCGHVRVNVDRE